MRSGTISPLILRLSSWSISCINAPGSSAVTLILFSFASMTLFMNNERCCFFQLADPRFLIFSHRFRTRYIRYHSAVHYCSLDSFLPSTTTITCRCSSCSNSMVTASAPSCPNTLSPLRGVICAANIAYWRAHLRLLWEPQSGTLHSQSLGHICSHHQKTTCLTRCWRYQLPKQMQKMKWLVDANTWWCIHIWTPLSTPNIVRWYRQNNSREQSIITIAGPTQWPTIVTLGSFLLEQLFHCIQTNSFT